jgi:Zn-dependent protease with chaperone function
MAFAFSYNGAAIRRLAAAGIGLSMAIAAPATAHPRLNQASLLVLAGQEQRLASVSYRLSLANANRCANPGVLTGLVVHDLTQYDRRSRADVARTFLLGNGIGVLAVASGSAAERAGLAKNDEILAVDGVDVQASSSAASQPAASYDRVAAFTSQLNQKLRTDVVQLIVRRQGVSMPMTLAGELGCGGQATLMPSGQLNAWSDGTYVAITTKLMSFATDGELAFVVAHEMSHNILGHQEKLGNVSSGLFSNFGRNAARIKTTEVEADQFAIALMNEAGCDLNAATAFLQRSGKKRPFEIATTHPGTGTRIQLVSAAIAHLPAYSGVNNTLPYQLASASVPSPTWYSLLSVPDRSSIGAMGTEAPTFHDPMWHINATPVVALPLTNSFAKSGALGILPAWSITGAPTSSSSPTGRPIVIFTGNYSFAALPRLIPSPIETGSSAWLLRDANPAELPTPSV